MYSVFMIDPPWPRKKGGIRKERPNQTRELDYRTLPVNTTFHLLDTEIFPLGIENHVVFLWTVEKFLAESDNQMIDRGYKRHARLIWDKENGVAPAFTIRFCHEYLVWYYKSPMLKIDKVMRGKFGSVIREKSRQHSRKPDAAYNFVKQLYPGHKMLDVFSRETRKGWDVWGDEVDYF